MIDHMTTAVDEVDAVALCSSEVFKALGEADGVLCVQTKETGDATGRPIGLARDGHYHDDGLFVVLPVHYHVRKNRLV